jgi:hypothetical protein
MWAILGKYSLRLELAGRQFVTRAGATPDRWSKLSTFAQADPSSAHRPSISTRRQNPPIHASRSLTTFIVIFLISSPFHPYLPFGASPSTSCLHSATEGPWSPSDGDHSLRRLIAVTRVPEGASPRFLVSPVALLRSVKVETFLLQHPPPPPSRSAYRPPQAGLPPLRPLSPEQKSFRPDLS